jgi:hypothetical protein
MQISRVLVQTRLAVLVAGSIGICARGIWEVARDRREKR